MKTVAILQARTSSSRLPGKVLLPIGGMPIVVLAAKRAANTGRHLIVATSTEASDDSLATLLESYGLNCFRGSLNNTLNRLVSALSTLDDQTIVFRLTADNLLPDGALLDEIEADFLNRKLDYLCCNGEPSGLPYGMSVEVTRLGYLREADREAELDFDREHVTPYIVKKFGKAYFEKYKALGLGHFRATIDCLDDYLNIEKLFAGLTDSVFESAFNLAGRLRAMPNQPLAELPVPRLVFGTAQLGLNYGIANSTGQPDQQTSEALIKTAISNGVAYLDTARSYGSSEEIIGQSLKNGWTGRTNIITKLSPLQACPANAQAPTLNSFVDASVFESCSKLIVQKIDILMLHRAAHLIDWNGGVWRRLLELKKNGVIRELGVSVQSPTELSMSLRNSEVNYIQIPFNILDWRWDAMITDIVKAKKQRKIIIHVRSALLQGLLTSKEERQWLRAHVTNSAVVVDWLESQAKHMQFDSVADLCLNYVNSLPWVDGVAVGMERIEQLIQNINLFNRPLLSANQIEVISQSRPYLSENSLNPSLWRNLSQ